MSTHKMFTYTSGDEYYQNTALYHIDKDDTKDSSVLDGILPPVKVRDLYPSPTTPISQDANVNSYISKNRGRNVLRFIVYKIVTNPVGDPSITCVYTELDANYAAVSEPDITLVEKEGSLISVATDPHGITQVDETLYISDYDSARIWLLGIEALAGVPAPEPPVTIPTLTLDPPIDLTDTLPKIDPPAPGDYSYHGNGIMALPNGNDNYLFAVFIASDTEAVPTYADSQLARIKLNSSGTAATELAFIPLGPNTVDMDLTYDKDGNPVILLTSIGGGQHAASTNEEDSMISKVVDLFSANFTKGNNLVDLIKGNSWDPINPVGDLRSLTVEGNGNIDILAGYFNSENYTGFDWYVYRTNNSRLLNIEDAISISKAVAQGVFTVIGHDTCSPGYYWSLMSGKGRLILIKGSSVVITDAAAPDFSIGGKNVTFGPGTEAGDIGNINTNSIDFTEATEALLAQLIALEGARQLHHHRHHHIHHLAQQAQQAAAIAAAQAAQPAAEAKEA
jgi:hypothetical protein